MNLTTLSLYPGRDVDRPTPTNHDRLQALRSVMPQPLSNAVFRFKRAKQRRHKQNRV